MVTNTFISSNSVVLVQLGSTMTTPPVLVFHYNANKLKDINKYICSILYLQNM